MFDSYIETLNSASSRPPWYKESFYDTLGLLPCSSPAAIKLAYKELILKQHPDKGGSTENFQKINKAYSVLSNPETRGLYDDYGEKAVELYLEFQRHN